MAFVSIKTIKGKKRYYLEGSIRFPNGKVMKFSVYLKNYNPKKKYKDIGSYNELLNSKISKGLTEFAAEYYKKSNIFDEVLIKNGITDKNGNADYKRLTQQEPTETKFKVISDIANKGGITFKISPLVPQFSREILNNNLYKYGDKFGFTGNDLREWEKAVRNMEPNAIMTLEFQKNGIELKTENKGKATKGTLSKSASEGILNEFSFAR